MNLDELTTHWINKGEIMPFKSKAQMRYMYAKMPKTAKKWSKETKCEKCLPEKKKKK